MTKPHPKNERIKRDYYTFLSEADQKTPATVEQVRIALNRFDDYNKHKDFAVFHREQAMAFKKFMANTVNAKTGKPLALATVNSTINQLKAFFRWLVMQPGYKTICAADIAYFNLSEREIKIAKQPRRKRFPTLEQIRRCIHAMPATTAIEKRDRTLVAFTALTGMRDTAITTVTLRNLDIHQEIVIQDPRDGVQTKFAKYIETTFFPVGDDFKQIVVEWVEYLQTALRYSPDAPLFPRTCIKQNSNKEFAPIGLEPHPWRDASPIRRIFKQAFEAAGMPYFNPHSFRDMLTHLGYTACKTPEQWKAWSQNLGHENVATTYNSYGQLSFHRQADVMRGLSE